MTARDRYRAQGPIPKGRRPTKTFEYRDASGKIVFWKRRFDFDGKKAFDVGRFEAKRWVSGKEGISPVLFGLPALQGQEHVYVCEGESDALAVSAAGGVATTNPFGALEPWRPAYTAQLARAGVQRVTIIPDLDGPSAKVPYVGERRAERIAAALRDAGFTVEILQPAAGCKDAREHLERGAKLTDLEPFVAPPVTSDFRLLTDVEIETEPDPAWLLDGVLPAGAFAVLYGASEGGKSFLALDWALSIATGEPWRGRPVQRGPVVYVAAEGWSGTKRRVRAWKIARAYAGGAGVLFLSGNVQLMERAEVEKLLAAIRAKLGEAAPVLIVFDTLNQNMPGGDENSPKDMGLAIDAAQFLRRESGATVLFVHHPRKADEVERGHSSLRNAADTMLQLTVEDDEETRRLACTKQKDAGPFDPVRFALLEHGGSLVVSDPRTEAGPGRPLTKSERQAFDALSKIVLGDDFAPYGRWEEASKLAHGTFAGVVKRLVEDLELVERKGAGRNQAFRLQPEPQLATY